MSSIGPQLGLAPTPNPSFTPAPQQAPQSTPSPYQPPPQSVGSGSSTIMPDPSTLDPQVLKVLHAIRNVESQGNYNAVGDNGSSMGAFQWNNGPTPVQPGQTPKNWQNAAKQYLGDANAPMSPENQNYVAYQQISAYKAQGLSPNSIDALWNGAKPDPTQPGQYLHNNPQRLTTFQNALQQEISNNPSQNGSTEPQNQPEGAPSVGGFLGNVVKSGANFAGNLVNAAIHPIQTVQGIGSMAAGGLQELGGQQNDNTAHFDQLKNYLGQRYGSVDNLLHTAYTDPVGLAADVSAALGVGGGIVGVAGKSAELAGLADTAETLGGVAGKLGKASTLANPLTPVISGASKLLQSSGVVSSEIGSQLTGFEPQTIDKIIANPGAFSPEEIANSSRIALAKQVEDALNAKEATLSETGTGYDSIRQPGAIPSGFENVTHAPPANAIPVSQNFIEDQLRSVAKVDVQDGNIVTKGTSVIRAAKDVKSLQNLLDTWKPEFQKGYLTPEELLNFRTDLAAAAKFEREFSASKPVESIAAEIRSNLNANYRGAVPGLEQLDTQFATQRSELSDLRKGLIDKNGDLLPSAINRIANATGKGKDLQLAQLEQLVPGIGKKIEVLKAIEDIQKAGGTKVGTYPSAFLKAGGVMAGLATGNLPLAATAAATMIIASPGIAVPLLRALGGGEPFIKTVMSHLAKYATIGAVASASANGSGVQTPQDSQGQGAIDQSQGNTASQTPTQNPSSSGVPSPDTTTSTPQTQGMDLVALATLAKSKHFDLSSALASGHTPEEIQTYLTSLK